LNEYGFSPAELNVEELHAIAGAAIASPENDESLVVVEDVW
jgi:hypothetical protein